MKKFISCLLLLIVLTNVVGLAAHVYPEYTVANKKTALTTERVNIVFDNSGHDAVKNMLVNVFRIASFMENSEVWIYPITGSNEPIKIEPTKEFVEANFNKYSKSSNEFKFDNMMEKAINDLKMDTGVLTKRLVMYVDNNTKDIRSEYGRFGQEFYSYVDNNTDIYFTSFDVNGNIYSPSFSSEQRANYDYISGKKFVPFFLVKYGYSECEAIYNKEEGYLKFEKGKANNNILVLASDDNYGMKRISENDDVNTYLSGAAMNTKAFEEYNKKSKVKGVALSYNHIITGGVEYPDSVMITALYTLDGQTVDPVNDDVYIPLINAEKVTVYHKETKGAGVCSADTTYNTAQDKELTNLYYVEPVVEEKESSVSSIFAEKKNTSSLGTGKKESVFSKILKGIGNVLKVIIGLIFTILRLAILAFIIALIAVKKFRAYVQLKILASKFGPYYEKFSTKIKKILKDIMDSGKKIKGDADLNTKYIFISKASADIASPNNRIELVIGELEKRGISCWLSEKGIKPGQNYNAVLPEAIRKCALFLLFVSTTSVNSSEVVSEISTAKEYKKNIIPVQIEPFDLFGEFTDWSYMLKPYQKTDLFHSKPEEISSLADYIEELYNRIK